MRPYSEAVKADVRLRMGPPHRQSVTEISSELGILVITLYKWRKAWRLQGEVVPASQKDPGTRSGVATPLRRTAYLMAHR
jgi:transposase-like protein